MHVENGVVEHTFIALFSIATVVAIAVSRTRVPYTVALVVVGLLVGSLHIVDPPTSHEGVAVCALSSRPDLRSGVQHSRQRAARMLAHGRRARRAGRHRGDRHHRSVDRVGAARVGTATATSPGSRAWSSPRSSRRPIRSRS